MKRRRGMLQLVVMLSMLALLSGACSSTRTAGERLDDSVVTSKVKTKLAADPQVNPFEIDVDTIDGVVYLRGTVETRVARTEAEKLARGTTGVVNVVNQLTLGDHTVGEELTDAKIASIVKTKLAADPEINPFDIDVDVDLGVVTLAGRVRTTEQKREAEHLTRTTKGVKSVRNEITVKPAS